MPPRSVLALGEAHHPVADAPLCEGMEEMFTVRRLGVADRQKRGFSAPCLCPWSLTFTAESPQAWPQVVSGCDG
jgi:hypothetical protein